MPAVLAFNEDEDTATLNAINTAIEEVLSERKWEFDLRHAQFTLKARIDDLSCTVTSGASQGTVTKTGWDTTTEMPLSTNDSFIVRLLADGSSNYANTSLRCPYGTAAGTTATFQFATEVHEGMSSVDAELYFSEYVLPDTVEEVVRITYQEYPLTLEQVDPTISYEEIFPQPHIEYGEPRVVAVGGLDIETYAAGASEPAPGLRMAVWPVPDDEYVIDYTYRYRHPELTATTSTLDGVPPNVVSRIVDLAANDMKIYYDKDYNALAVRRAVEQRTEGIYESHGGSRTRRKTIENWDGMKKNRPSLIHGFPGRLIGS
jgi:hypothetical protein